MSSGIRIWICIQKIDIDIEIEKVWLQIHVYECVHACMHARIRVGICMYVCMYVGR